MVGQTSHCGNGLVILNNSDQTSGESTPTFSEGAPKAAQHASDQWIMKSLNDLKENMKEVRADQNKKYGAISNGLSNISDRLGRVESRISRLIWVTGAVGTTLAVIWGGYEFLSQFVDIALTVTPKE